MTQAIAQEAIAGADQAQLQPAMVQARGVVKRYDTGKVEVQALRGGDGGGQPP